MPSSQESHARDREPLNQKIAHQITLLIGEDHDRSTLLHDLKIFRRTESSLACPCLYEPSLILVVQGQKKMLLNKQEFIYDPHHFLLTSLDIPASTQVLEAHPDKPCLGLSLHLDRKIITDLGSHLSIPSNVLPEKSAATSETHLKILDAIFRLLELLQEPESISFMAPLILKEIYYRLLKSDVAPLLWNIAASGSTGHRVAHAIQWLKRHYAQPILMTELAQNVQMSPSSLHHHFRQLTGKSPLQYQKWLRLNEARRLMINHHLDAATASYQTGYESPSHFSRDYKKLFGLPPKQDMKRQSSC
ncbi:helix-turn-helix domain-containing protein [Saccharibacter sp. 17.LH.SD]|uniref:AraC family transcriptional regulator n=1 Tax=Saccharibacter sp. 17.LH.SD TaxID=2689393 RepID=UPI00136B1D57|nr:AraC family transcriptional regulator [Saccharibacter sp. 17.LH.SD]MXV44566.1 helix-turn-helix domain-containing protein [Saccharibacter sp. 17.LH.SD]